MPASASKRPNGGSPLAAPTRARYFGKQDLRQQLPSGAAASLLRRPPVGLFERIAQLCRGDRHHAVGRRRPRHR